MRARHACVLALGALALISPAAAGAARKPDLKVVRVTPTIAARDLTVQATVANKGRKKAAASVAAMLLSRDAARSADDPKWVAVRVPKLASRSTKQVQGTATVPAGVAGDWFVIVCADSGRVVRERSERNNCKASGRVSIPAPGEPGATPTPTATPSPGPTATPSATPTATATASPPAAPTLTATDPASGSEENTPRVQGTAEADTTISVYRSTDCSGSPAATGTAAQLTGAGIPVALEEDADTSLTARAERNGAQSSCSNALHYHDPSALNETDSPAEGDSCTLYSPLTVSANPGETFDVYGRLLEAGVTEAPGGSIAVRMEVGLGPTGSDPRTDAAWTWLSMAWVAQAGTEDEYKATAVAPETARAYTVRVSLNGGGAWTYCDANGAGSTAGLTFELAQLGTLGIIDPDDGDGDGVPNTTDNCPSQANPDQADNDADGKGNACDPCPDAANPGTSANCPVSVYDVNQGVVPDGSGVRVIGLVVTAKTSTNFWMQLPSSAPEYVGAPGSALEVFVNGPPPVAVGDVVTVDATLTTFNNGFLLTQPTVIVTAQGNPVPAPTVVTTSASLVNLNSVLVQVADATLTAKQSSAKWTVASNAEPFVVSRAIIGTFPDYPISQHFTSVTGIADSSSPTDQDQEIRPRTAADFVPG